VTGARELHRLETTGFKESQFRETSHTVMLTWSASAIDTSAMGKATTSGKTRQSFAVKRFSRLH
jgi:hypothetical protein